MRIGFTGTQGTGKTTLAQAWKKYSDEWLNRDWEIVPSTARLAKQAGYSINRDADPLSQLITTIARVNAENNAAKDHEKVLSERTPIDSLAYTTWQFNNVWKSPNAYYWQQCMNLVEHHMPLYDSVILFPPFWKPEGDGVRDTDVQYQHEIHDLIVGILDHSQVNYTVMPNLDVHARVGWLENHLTKLTKTDKL